MLWKRSESSKKGTMVIYKHDHRRSCTILLQILHRRCRLAQAFANRFQEILLFQTLTLYHYICSNYNLIPIFISLYYSLSVYINSIIQLNNDSFLHCLGIMQPYDSNFELSDIYMLYLYIEISYIGLHPNCC